MTAESTRLLRRAERSLLRETGAPIHLSRPETLPSPHWLLRCQVDGIPGLDSVVIKEIRTVEFTEDSGERQSHRFRNELATLTYLQSLPDDGPWPSLIAAEPDDGFVIVEDLGEHPTVEQTLLTGDRASAGRSLGCMGATLGRFHAVSIEALSGFVSMRDRLAVVPPRSDSTYDLRRGHDAIDNGLAELDVAPARGFAAELTEVEEGLHSPGRLTTVIHADAGPQNFIWSGGGAFLVDFEFATVGSPFLDLVSARLAFPHSSEARTVPPGMVQQLEDRYRREMSPVAPQFEDDATFVDGVVDACAHWALVRWAGLWRRLFTGDDDGDNQRESMRSQAFTVFRRFVETAEAAGRRHAIAATMEGITKVIEQRTPSVTESPVYPAFQD